MNRIRVAVLSVVLFYLLTAQLAAQQIGSPVPQSTKSAANKPLAWHDALEAALARKVSLDVKDTPLQEVIQALADQAGFPFRLSKKIEDAGVQKDQPVTASFRELSLEAVLKHVLDDLHLTFMLSSELIVITTVEDAQSPENVITCVYPVKDLLESQPRPDASHEPLYDFDPLIDLIHSAIEPDGWGDGNSSGTLQGFHTSGAIVVTNRREVHKRIAQLLADLRKAKTEAVQAPLKTVVEPLTKPRTP